MNVQLVATDGKETKTDHCVLLVGETAEITDWHSTHRRKMPVISIRRIADDTILVRVRVFKVSLWQKLLAKLGL